MAKKKVVKKRQTCHLSSMHVMVYLLLIILGAKVLGMFFVEKIGYPEGIFGIVYYGFWFLITLIMLLIYEYS